MIWDQYKCIHNSECKMVSECRFTRYVGLNMQRWNSKHDVNIPCSWKFMIWTKCSVISEPELFSLIILQLFSFWHIISSQDSNKDNVKQLLISILSWTNDTKWIGWGVYFAKRQVKTMQSRSPHLRCPWWQASRVVILNTLGRENEGKEVSTLSSVFNHQ